MHQFNRIIISVSARLGFITPLCRQLHSTTRCNWSWAEFSCDPRTALVKHNFCNLTHQLSLLPLLSFDLEAFASSLHPWIMIFSYLRCGIFPICPKFTVRSTGVLDHDAIRHLVTILPSHSTLQMKSHCSAQHNLIRNSPVSTWDLHNRDSTTARCVPRDTPFI